MIFLFWEHILFTERMGLHGVYTYVRDNLIYKIPRQ